MPPSNISPAPTMTIEERLTAIGHLNEVWEFDPETGDVDKLVAATRAAIEALDAHIETTPFSFGDIIMSSPSDSRRVSGMTERGVVTVQVSSEQVHTKIPLGLPREFRIGNYIITKRNGLWRNSELQVSDFRRPESRELFYDRTATEMKLTYNSKTLDPQKILREIYYGIRLHLGICGVILVRKHKINLWAKVRV